LHWELTGEVEWAGPKGEVDNIRGDRGEVGQSSLELDASALEIITLS